MADVSKDASAMNDEEDTQGLAIGRLSQIVYFLGISQAITSIGLVMFGWFVFHIPRVPVGVGPHGEAVPLVRLDVARYTDARVQADAEETLRITFAHDFQNYGDTIEAMSDRYTPEGFEQVKQQLAPFIKQMRERRYVMSASIERPAIVVDGRTIRGVYVWTVQSEIVVNRLGENDHMTPTPFYVTMKIQQVPLDMNIAGIATASLDMSPA
jgi:hypothetical protein